MVFEATSEAGALLPPAQDRAQPPSDEAVSVAKHGGNGVFEVTEPSSKHGIEIGDDPIQAHAPVSLRPGAQLFPERFQALLAHVPSPALEPIAQKFESLARLSGVADPCLVRVRR